MAGISKQEDFQKTALRLPKDLHAKVIESAKSNNRTMNAEIVARLESSFESEGMYVRKFSKDSSPEEMFRAMQEINAIFRAKFGDGPIKD